MIENLPSKEIFLLIFGTLSTYLIWRVQYQKEKIKNIENPIAGASVTLVPITIKTEQNNTSLQSITKHKSTKKSANQRIFLYLKRSILLLFFWVCSWFVRESSQSSSEKGTFYRRNHEQT